MSDVIESAYDLARSAHAGQFRKYTNEPYLAHPFRVAAMVAVFNLSAHGDDDIAAAVLHDVMEDCDVKREEIEEVTNRNVADMVWYLTNPPGETGNRAERKAKARNRLVNAPPSVKTIKLADIADNVPSIVEHDPGFAKIYVKEKRLMLGCLADASSEVLFRHVRDILDNSEEKLNAQ